MPSVFYIPSTKDTSQWTCNIATPFLCKFTLFGMQSLATLHKFFVFFTLGTFNFHRENQSPCTFNSSFGATTYHQATCWSKVPYYLIFLCSRAKWYSQNFHYIPGLKNIIHQIKIPCTLAIKK